MKIFIVHNEYQHKSGEESAVQNECDALRSRGHTVVVYTVSNEEISTTWSKIKSGLASIYNFRQKKILEQRLLAERPDIVHVHNFFPIISPAVFDLCSKLRVPVVHSLHNYRLLCPSVTLFHDNEIYLNGLNGDFFRTLKDRPYRNSYLGTLFILLSNCVHQVKKTWSKIDKIVAFTQFQKNIVEPRIKANLQVIPHFTTKPKVSIDVRIPTHAFHIFVGRLDREKGIMELVENWPESETLLIAGKGELLGELHAGTAHQSNIQILGQQSRNEVAALMRRATSCVVPSRFHETFGLVIIESFAVGTPVLVNDLAPFNELVESGFTGYKFELGEPKSLSIALASVSKNREVLSKNCISEYTNKYSEEVGVASLEKLFQDVIDRSITRR